MQSYETGLSVTKTGFFVLSEEALPGEWRLRIDGAVAQRNNSHKTAVSSEAIGVNP